MDKFIRVRKKFRTVKLFRENINFETKTEIKHCVRNRGYIFGCIKFI